MKFLTLFFTKFVYRGTEAEEMIRGNSRVSVFICKYFPNVHPNVITGIRGLMIGLYLFPINQTTAGIILIFAIITDFLDGILARGRGQQSLMGSILDPMIDKFLGVAILWYTLLHNLLSVKVVLLVFTFEFVKFLWFWLVSKPRGDNIRPNILGRLQQLIYGLAFLFLFFNGDLYTVHLLIGIALVVGTLGTISYVIQGNTLPTIIESDDSVLFRRAYKQLEKKLMPLILLYAVVPLGIVAYAMHSIRDKNFVTAQLWWTSTGLFAIWCACFVFLWYVARPHVRNAFKDIRQDIKQKRYHGRT